MCSWLIIIFCACLFHATTTIKHDKFPNHSPTHFLHQKFPTTEHGFQRSRFSSFENSFKIQGERIVTEKSVYKVLSTVRRPGLTFLDNVLQYLPRILAHHSSPSKNASYLAEEWSNYLNLQQIHQTPWKMANEWISSTQSVVPPQPVGLGNILHSLKKTPISSADIGYKGTQLKVTLILQGKQKASFKPQWYSLTDVVEGEIYGGRDRHNGEIVSFYVGILLGLRHVPITTTRKVSLQRDLLPVASKKLTDTFFRNGTNTCLFGVCHFCNRNNFVCDQRGTIEGAITLWLPSAASLSHVPNPWGRSYKQDKWARWEEDANFCRSVEALYMRSERILDLIELCVLDFVIQNGDRHHYSVVNGGHVVALDNGKSFGDPNTDHLDILAPLLQCCVIRRQFYTRLLSLAGGGLSKALHVLLAAEIVQLLDAEHFVAIDRRLAVVLATILACKESKGKDTFVPI